MCKGNLALLELEGISKIQGKRERGVVDLS